MKIKLLFIAVAILSATQAKADFKGTVLSIRDGGSVIVNSNGQDIVVKLNSIATPYPNQNLYAQSRVVSERIFLGRNVNVITNNNPSNGCVHGELISEGINLNEALLLTGFGWLFNESTAPARYRAIEEENKKLQRGLFNPDYHFQFNSISSTPSYLYKECLAASAKVPISQEHAFLAEQNKYGFGYSIKSVIIGILLGIGLLMGLFYFDRLGLDINLSKHFKRKKRDGDDGFR